MVFRKSGFQKCPICGNLYDRSKVSECPRCARPQDSGEGIDDYGETEVLSPSESLRYADSAPSAPADGIGVTEPIFREDSRNTGGGVFSHVSDFDQPESTVYTSFHQVADFSGSRPTKPPASPPSQWAKEQTELIAAIDDPEITQYVGVNGARDFLPVVGWLVCVEGADHGRDYRIHAGYNYLGRSSSMDICVNGDTQISRARNLLIAYDEEENRFFCSLADGKNTVRLNGKLLMMPTELHAYDVLSIGSTKLMFVPLCGDRFSWKAEL